jgi:two-component system sensor histidine kinase CiaH
MKLSDFALPVSLKNLSQFQIARLRLTAWYLLIIMLVSIFFSVAIFHFQSDDLMHRFGRFIFRPNRDPSLFPPPSLQVITGQQIVSDTLERLRWNLFYINLGILAFSAGASYFLAGRTLRPIQESMNEQTRFIADASHEIRTPLTALKTSTEVALRDKHLTVRGAKELLSSNLTRINNMQGLAEALLTLAKNGELGNAEKVPVNLQKVVDNALISVTEQAQKKRIAIETKIGSKKVLGDEKALTQLLAILLDNAIKYGPTKAEVKITAESLDHLVEINVTDTGPGIKKSDLPFIFNRFYRSDKSRSAETAGFGLGLPIAKKIVEDHGGSISVESSFGEGTHFTVRLPRA